MGTLILSVACSGCFFNDTAATEIYTYGHPLSLHAALPIYARDRRPRSGADRDRHRRRLGGAGGGAAPAVRSAAAHHARRVGAAPFRSEEHTSELQSLMRI